MQHNTKKNIKKEHNLVHTFCVDKMADFSFLINKHYDQDVFVTAVFNVIYFIAH